MTLQAKDDIEKDIFLAEVDAETKKIDDAEVKEGVKKKAGALFAIVFDVSNKGIIIADNKEIKRRLRQVIEE